jgi:hypothetical protein
MLDLGVSDLLLTVELFQVKKPLNSDRAILPQSWCVAAIKTTEQNNGWLIGYHTAFEERALRFYSLRTRRKEVVY